MPDLNAPLGDTERFDFTKWRLLTEAAIATGERTIATLEARQQETARAIATRKAELTMLRRALTIKAPAVPAKAPVAALPVPIRATVTPAPAGTGSPARERLRDFLRREPGDVGIRACAAAAGVVEAHIYTFLRDMQASGEVEKVRIGRYRWIGPRLLGAPVEPADWTTDLEPVDEGEAGDA